MKKTSFLRNVRSWIVNHKIASTLVTTIAIVGGIYLYTHLTGSGATTVYTLSPASIGTIRQTVTGSGQVAAQNQIDISSEVSATVLSVNVEVGQKVSSGQLIATLDARDAAIELESARIAMEKLVRAADADEIYAAESNLDKSYDDAFSAADSAFLDLPVVMDGLDELLYSKNGYLSEQKSTSLPRISRTYRDTAADKFDIAHTAYSRTLEVYKKTARTSATSSIEAMLTDTYNLIKTVSDALKEAQDAIIYISKNDEGYQSNLVDTAKSDVDEWLTNINNSLSAILSANKSIADARSTLDDLVDGADDLDIRSQQLSLQQKIRSYDKYFIRAPFDGVIGKISVDPYDKVSSGTAIATIIGQHKISNISLNEVDAAKVAMGQPVEITFDAIDGLTATGTVAQVDQIGTVSSGVVSYGVKISIDTQDDRIKPGMSMNVSITTQEKSDVLVVPSSAIKTKNGSKYVEIVDTGRSASSTSTRNRSITVSSEQVTPRQVTVTTGSSDDSNTEIIGGISMGDMVVTKTTTGTSGTTSGAPSILNSFTPQRNRTTTSTGASTNRTSSSGTSGSSSAAPSGPPPAF